MTGPRKMDIGIKLATSAPEPAHLCTAALIQATTFTRATPALREQLRALRDAVYNHFSITIRHDAAARAQRQFMLGFQTVTTRTLAFAAEFPYLTGA